MHDGLNQINRQLGAREGVIVPFGQHSERLSSERRGGESLEIHSRWDVDKLGTIITTCPSGICSLCGLSDVRPNRTNPMDSHAALLHQSQLNPVALVSRRGPCSRLLHSYYASGLVGLG